MGGKISPKGKGKLNLGITVEPTQLMMINKMQLQEKKNNADIFGTENKLKLGPGSYDAQVNLTKHKSPATKFEGNKTKDLDEMQLEEMSPGERVRETVKKMRKFDGSSATFKKIERKPNCAPLEER